MWKAILGDTRSMVNNRHRQSLMKILVISTHRSLNVHHFTSSSLSSQFNLIDKVHSKIIIIIIQKPATAEKHATHQEHHDSMAS